jgi:hypothetical protein
VSNPAQRIERNIHFGRGRECMKSPFEEIGIAAGGGAPGKSYCKNQDITEPGQSARRL